eukprot:TRINITY_DN1821_c0_g1_i1.p2 TRINITY_DN1821_c0_g1~~TRINITY_DN1821_c0_g1_i1.p2  ORF type:complete len:155 (-),score=31.62 TRINITY_DN1821_c0_g1_i1:145-609(-)
MYEVYVGNIAPLVTKEIIRELFTQVAPVCKVTVPQNRPEGGNSYAFVELKNEESAQYVVNVLNGTVLHGVAISVRRKDLDGYKLYVGNLDPSITVDDLHHLFAPFGDLLSQEKSVGSTYGFVLFSCKLAAEDAIKGSHKKVVLGRPMTVNFAKR